MPKSPAPETSAHASAPEPRQHDAHVSAFHAQRTLAQRTLNEIDQLLRQEDFKSAEAVLERAFDEARADFVLHNCTELALDNNQVRFRGEEIEDFFPGALPPVGTLYRDVRSNLRYFIASHKGV